jgi:hypothetical protein
MHALALALAAMTMTSPADDPVMVLEAPGIAFSALPPELAEPVYGEMTEESGYLESAPNDLGLTYQIDYRRLEEEPGFRRGDWLVEQVRGSIITEEDQLLQLSDEVKWAEGSRQTEHRNQGSVGLVPWVNFNVIRSSNGAILFSGRSAAVFRSGYVTRLTVISPPDHTAYARESLMQLLDRIYITD